MGSRSVNASMTRDRAVWLQLFPGMRAVRDADDRTTPGGPARLDVGRRITDLDDRAWIVDADQLHGATNQVRLGPAVRCTSSLATEQSMSPGVFQPMRSSTTFNVVAVEAGIERDLDLFFVERVKDLARRQGSRARRDDGDSPFQPARETFDGSVRSSASRSPDPAPFWSETQLADGDRLGKAHAGPDPVAIDPEPIGRQGLGHRVDHQIAVEHRRAGDIENDEPRVHRRWAILTRQAFFRLCR